LVSYSALPDTRYAIRLCREVASERVAATGLYGGGGDEGTCRLKIETFKNRKRFRPMRLRRPDPYTFSAVRQLWRTASGRIVHPAGFPKSRLVSRPAIAAITLSSRNGARGAKNSFLLTVCGVERTRCTTLWFAVEYSLCEDPEAKQRYPAGWKGWASVSPESVTGCSTFVDFRSRVPHAIGVTRSRQQAYATEQGSLQNAQLLGLH